MAKKNSTKPHLPPEAISGIQERLASEQSYSQIARWLKEEFEITWSRTSICRYAQKLRLTRRELCEDVLRPYVIKSLTTDLEILQDKIQKLNKRAEKARKEENLADEMKVLDRLHKMLTLSFKVKGIGVNEPEPETSTSEILSKEELDDMFKDHKVDNYGRKLKPEPEKD